MILAVANLLPNTRDVAVMSVDNSVFVALISRGPTDS